ncbi:MAG: acyl-CoA dehydrogenase C-terminal domain-containing protein [Burkholderiales bacterium]|nr:acyl-CoA dehydrogenase C-terminal domain-containing protein [Burkholderiales bacterium]
MHWATRARRVCAHQRPDTAGSHFAQGKLGAARYFFHDELPRVAAWLKVVEPATTSVAPERGLDPGR